MFLTLILAISDPGGDGDASGLLASGTRQKGETNDGFTAQSDVVLVRAAQRGDSSAFAALHKRYYARIYLLAHLKTNNTADAEDVASETFLRALASLQRFDFKSTGGGAST